MFMVLFGYFEVCLLQKAHFIMMQKLRFVQQNHSKAALEKSPTLGELLWEKHEDNARARNKTNHSRHHSVIPTMQADSSTVERRPIH